MNNVIYVILAGFIAFAGSSCTAVPETVRQQRLLDAHLANARTGDAHSKAVVGAVYWIGELSLRDPEEAIRWFRKGAIQGDAICQMGLGICLLGDGDSSQTSKQGVEWLKRAARQNQAEAQLILGMCYEDGFVVAQDINEAIVWYSKASTSDSIASADTSRKARRYLRRLLSQPVPAT